MAENSHIEWTTHTFNPWMGCTKVSDGCKHCYAETLMDKRHNRVQWGPKGARLRTSPQNWNKPLIWNREAERLGIRYRVFCASLADIFEGPGTMPEESWPVVSKAREDLNHMIHVTPFLDWQILTKRPENVTKWGPQGYDWERGGLPKNVWIGTSCEDQKTADERIPHLLRLNAAVRFLSCEPLLGEIQLCFGDRTTWLDNLHWIIVGGESGPGKRPMDMAWARSIRDQCKAANVPFFMKQIDKVQPIPPDLMVREFPA